jgi:hypothetical protein
MKVIRRGIRIGPDQKCCPGATDDEKLAPSTQQTKGKNSVTELWRQRKEVNHSPTKLKKKNEIKFYSNVQIPDRNVEENISKYLNY